MSPHFRKQQAHEYGQLTEQFAREYLESKGLKFIAANVRYRFGEIDLIMSEPSSIIFVEVKYRRNALFGGAVSSLSTQQQRRLRNAAKAWLQKHDPQQHFNCRFDMIALEGEISRLDCLWLKNIL